MSYCKRIVHLVMFGALPAIVHSPRILQSDFLFE